MARGWINSDVLVERRTTGGEEVDGGWRIDEGGADEGRGCGGEVDKGLRSDGGEVDGRRNVVKERRMNCGDSVEERLTKGREVEER